MTNVPKGTLGKKLWMFSHLNFVPGVVLGVFCFCQFFMTDYGHGKKLICIGNDNFKNPKT